MVSFLLLRVLLVVLLVAANAFFVAAEFALVSVRDTRLQQLVEARRIGARTVQKLHQRLAEVLAGVQFGVTLASLLLGWIGEPVVARMFQNVLANVPHAGIYAHTLAVVISFSLITYLLVILGEIVPKSVALQRAERVALAVAGPMDVFLAISRPFLYVMNRSADAVLRAFGSRQIRSGAAHSPEELKLIVAASRRFGLIPAFEEEIIAHALELGEVTVREVMVPRPNIFSFPADLTLDEAVARVVEEQHSRIPVFDPQRGPEHIVGILYAKDLMRWMRLRVSLSQAQPAAARVAKMPISQIMRDVLVVPETKPLGDLLTEFKQRKRHLAVVVDEFGSTVGVVTVEDVLEQLVGEIEDEFDVAAMAPLKAGATMVLEGAANVLDLDSQYQLSLPRNEGFETLAGFVLTRLQKIPIAGDSFEYEGRRFTVVEMDGHRIAKVRIEMLQERLQAVGRSGD
ncbi:MAG TPA: hemolysin family protein [Terriglobales bacterium]|nr:hemolysin family protein [Terriglobales bacterium]